MDDRARAKWAEKWGLLCFWWVPEGEGTEWKQTA